MRQGIALIVSAPSGAGKSTLCGRLLDMCPNLAYSVSCTTRFPRPGETNGQDYHFLNLTEFENMRENGEFAEWACVHGNFYGTPLAAVNELLMKGRDILFDIDVQGAAQLKRSLPDSTFVFILPPSIATLEARLAARGTESREIIKNRIQNSIQEMRSAFWYDYLLLNDNLDLATQNLYSIYNASTLSASCNQGLVNKILSDGNNLEKCR